MVIPTYNRAPLLRATLASLVGQRTAASFEVIVADDGSADDSAQVVAGFRDRLTIDYARQKDRGYRVAAARNIGAAMAKAPILVFLDSGTLAGPDFLSGHLRRHSRAPAEGPRHPRIAGPRARRHRLYLRLSAVPGHRGVGRRG